MSHLLLCPLEDPKVRLNLLRLPEMRQTSRRPKLMVRSGAPCQLEKYNMSKLHITTMNPSSDQESVNTRDKLGNVTYKETAILYISITSVRSEMSYSRSSADQS